jgi:hypothetical protein
MPRPKDVHHALSCDEKIILTLADCDSRGIPESARI